MDNLTENLFKIVQDDDHQALQKLADDGTDLSVFDEYGSTLLHAASYDGKLKCLEVLIKNGQDIFIYNTPSRDGWNAVHFAACYGHFQCLELLAKYSKKDINAPDREGWTPAHVAARGGQVKCLEVLIKHGVDLNKPDERGLTPTDVAQGKCVEFLNSL